MKYPIVIVNSEDITILTEDKVEICLSEGIPFLASLQYTIIDSDCNVYLRSQFEVEYLFAPLSSVRIKYWFQKVYKLRFVDKLVSVESVVDCQNIIKIHIAKCKFSFVNSDVDIASIISRIEQSHSVTTFVEALHAYAKICKSF
ncbi:MAG: hypothetical protein RL660_2674 [Bacteroidota bacterium]|jgi:hypothetical protein